MSRPWQDDVALVLAAHGDQRGASPNASLLAHRERIAAATSFRHVAAGVLKGEPSLEAVLAGIGSSGATQVVVFPFFMADGYFVGRILPERIRAAGLDRCRILAPLGLDPRLASLIHADAVAAAHAAGFNPGSTRLLLAGHGSEIGPASAIATRRMAEHVSRLGQFACFATAYLEEPPFLDGELARACRPTVVSGFFSGDGLHAAEDVPNALRESGAKAVYAGSIGNSPAITGLVLSAVAAACGQP